MTFRVGQRVVCISDDWNTGGDIRLLPGNGYVDAWPKKGVIYTVRSIEESFLRLHEIINPVRMFAGGVSEVRFDKKRFRPVVERKTDISIFTAMLNTSKQGVEA